MPLTPVPARLRAVRHASPSAARPTGPPGRIAVLGRRSATSVVVSGLVVSMFGSPTFAAEGSVRLSGAALSLEAPVDDPAAEELALSADLNASLAADLGAESLTAVAAAGTRIASKHPFAVTAPANTSFGSGARFESSTSTRTAAFLRGKPVINHTNWTISVAIAKWTDPVAKVRNLKSGAVTSIRIPSTAKSTVDTDKAMTVIQPDGYTAYECYKMTKIGTNSWTTTSMVKQDLRSSGLAVGTRASGVSQLMGLIRADEVAAKKIPHTLAIAIPDSMLKNGYIWPARRQDSNASYAYKGQVPMGTMLGIPPSVNVSALGLSGEGLALAKALQNYGAHVVERAGMVALYAEPAANATAVNRMKTDWKKLYPLLRAVTNNTPSTVGGGGTRRVGAAAALK